MSQRGLGQFVWRAVPLVVLTVCALAGCSALPTPWRKVPLDASTGFYQQATLSYRLDAGKLQQPLDVARIDGQAVAYEQVASSPLAEQSLGTLTITYPHPAGRANVAQVKFALDSSRAKSAAAKRSSWNPFSKGWQAATPAVVAGSHPEVHELWVLDIPGAEANHYFDLLTQQGFYNTERAGGAKLAVTINGKPLEKNWEQIPELNALVQRVRGQGQLVSYARPDLLVDSHTALIASPRAYNDLLVQMGAADPRALAAAAGVNAFAMNPPSTPEGLAPSQGNMLARQPRTTR